MIIHELDDDDVGIGSTMVGTTRCGAIGTLRVHDDNARYLLTESGAVFHLSRLRRVSVGTGLHDMRPHNLDLDPTTCKHCRRLAKRRTPRQVPVAP